MRNPETGKYEARKFICRTNHEIVGIGDTKEEARADLKAKLKAYRGDRANQLQPTGLYLNSPGYVFLKDEKHRVSFRHHPERKAQVLARPDLAEYLRAERAKQEPEAPETPKS